MYTALRDCAMQLAVFIGALLLNVRLEADQVVFLFLMEFMAFNIS